MKFLFYINKTILFIINNNKVMHYCYSFMKFTELGKYFSPFE